MNLVDLLNQVKQKTNSTDFADIIENIKMLNKGQRDTLTAAIDVLYNSNKSICISGSAGTGKTFLVNTLLKMLDALYSSSKIGLSAPTHQAKKVLTKSTGREAFTVHSIFRILPDLSEDKTEFNAQNGDLPKLKDLMFLVIDEVSMIDEKLFRIIYDKLPFNCKIIALGDPYQLAPVNSEEISLFFTHDDFKQFKLTEIMRQKEGSPIIDQADLIRKRIQAGLTHQQGDGSSVLFCNTEREFLNKYLDFVKTPEDAKENRLIAYTNESVNHLNKIIRKVIHKTTDQLAVGELLVLQDPVVKGDQIIFNNGDILEVVDFQEKETTFYFNFSEDQLTVKYYQVFVENEDQEQNYINILKDEFFDDFNFKLHCEASQLKNHKQKNPKVRLGLEWKDWWKIKGFFTDTKPIFASTVHKAQGISLNNCFVYQKDFNKCSSTENYFQLLYVAITRARNNIYFV